MKPILFPQSSNWNRMHWLDDVVNSLTNIRKSLSNSKFEVAKGTLHKHNPCDQNVTYHTSNEDKIKHFNETCSKQKKIRIGGCHILKNFLVYSKTLFWYWKIIRYKKVLTRGTQDLVASPRTSNWFSNDVSFFQHSTQKIFW